MPTPVVHLQCMTGVSYPPIIFSLAQINQLIFNGILLEHDYPIPVLVNAGIILAT